MPARHRCYGNGLDDDGRVEQTYRPMPSEVYLRARFFHPPCTSRDYDQPLPIGHPTSNGRPVLFYGMIFIRRQHPLWPYTNRIFTAAVKATVQYHASEPENLELLEGDIVGVTKMRNDGWLTGEPLNEERRQPGRYLVPPAVVCACSLSLGRSPLAVGEAGNVGWTIMLYGA